MRVPIENKGQMPIYVAGAMIPPGETRLFEEEALPPEYRPAAAVVDEAVLIDPLAEVLLLSVDKVAKGLADLSAEELARLQLLEMEGKARKTLLEAIAEEGLRRADAAVNAGTGE